MSPLPWSAAWRRALYDAELGFYVRRGGPAAHFATATQGPTGAVLAEALLRLWDRHVPDRPPAVIVDIGAGRGELAVHLSALVSPTSPERSVRGSGGVVVGVDVVARPPGLDDRVDWLRAPGGADLPPELGVPAQLTDALVIAHEWLDVVPCTIAEADDTGTLREVLVDPSTGAERLGAPLDGPALAWARAHWPGTGPGDRVEVGRARDEAWAGLVARVASGLLVAVDYGHVQSERPRGGTLTAYRQGRLVPPVPDGTCDVTAHVAMDTLDADVLHRQRDLLVELGLDARPVERALAQRDPLGYLQALARASAEACLIGSGGFGRFWWALKRVGGADVA